MTVFEFEKGHEKVRLTLSEYRKELYLDLRAYYDASKDTTPDWKPSRKGLTLSVYFLDDLKKAIKAAEKAILKLEQKSDTQRGPQQHELEAANT